MAGNGEIKLLPCFFQGMTVVVADSFDPANHWEGVCFGAIEELNEYRYLIIPVGGTQPIMVHPAVNMWPAKNQKKFIDDIDNVITLVRKSEQTEAPKRRRSSKSGRNPKST